MEFIKETLSQTNINEENLYDIIYNLFLLAEIKESEEDIKKGRVMSLEEFKEYIDELKVENEDNYIK